MLFCIENFETENKNLVRIIFFLICHEQDIIFKKQMFCSQIFFIWLYENLCTIFFTAIFEKNLEKLFVSMLYKYD